ncbi:MAG: glutathione peroxidase [Acinetobacter populi]|jgi:glutathione peroxidase|uniref:glutathione peroxidase n=1 Tax=Acinetobacter populi TaxID=1582270 RepID=UPI002356268B|nr:glutathione peroxidase [Acinetobacter populi]MCH4248393.1 glutathione peroxidase [Acinetobacter populi]
MTSIYQFEAERLEGGEQSLQEYKDKVILIVNTASKCGFTPQFTGLEKLYKKYKDQGFVILGFPCNQFGGQDPGSNEEIGQFCQRNYGVSFPMFAKVDVKGPEAHPIFRYLTSETRGFINKNIKWNFTKFLVNKAGKVVGRYAPTTKPESLEEDIEKALKDA